MKNNTTRDKESKQGKISEANRVMWWEIPIQKYLSKWTHSIRKNFRPSIGEQGRKEIFLGARNRIERRRREIFGECRKSRARNRIEPFKTNRNIRRQKEIIPGEKFFQLLEKNRISIWARYSPLRAAKICGENWAGNHDFQSTFLCLKGLYLATPSRIPLLSYSSSQRYKDPPKMIPFVPKKKMRGYGQTI
jgi:hypothetical protein